MTLTQLATYNCNCLSKQYTCMFMCIHVCTYCICVCTVHMCMYLTYMYVYIHTYTHTHMHTFRRMSVPKTSSLINDSTSRSSGPRERRSVRFAIGSTAFRSPSLSQGRRRTSLPSGDRNRTLRSVRLTSRNWPQIW